MGTQLKSINYVLYWTGCEVWEAYVAILLEGNSSLLDVVHTKRKECKKHWGKKDHFRFEITILHIYVIMSIQKNIKNKKTLLEWMAWSGLFLLTFIGFD